MSFTTPIGFFIFNRPDLTQAVFNEIRKLRPTKLLVVADGSRSTGEGVILCKPNQPLSTLHLGVRRTKEAILCERTRAIIEEGVDWPCELLLNYSPVNLGCEKRVQSGYDWIFSHCEEAICLEDDTVPDQSFFWFCQELLEKYRDDPRIMMIGGTGYQPEASPYSYYFTKISHIWGWATWRRAWRLYDGELRGWHSRCDEEKRNLLSSNCVSQGWFNVLNNAKRVNTWDFQWQYSIWNAGGYAISPSSNLVRNIGFDGRATHTLGGGNRAPESHVMSFPLIHPPELTTDESRDDVAGKLCM